MRYVEDHDMVSFMWDILLKCFEYRAADPRQFVIELLQNMEPENVQTLNENINECPEVEQEIDSGDKMNSPQQKRAKIQEQLISEPGQLENTVDKTLKFFSQNSSGLVGNIITTLESGPSAMTRSKDSIAHSSSSFLNTLSEVSLQSQSEIASRLLARR